MYFRKANDQVSPLTILRAQTGRPGMTLERADLADVRTSVLLYLYIIYNAHRYDSSGKASPEKMAAGESLFVEK